jgi:cytochrome subunit of sulfide dehydrogenase
LATSERLIASTYFKQSAQLAGCRRQQMPIKIFRAGMVFGLYLIMTSSAAEATDVQILYTQSLAATCANCHGTQGKSVTNPSVPGLAGRPSAYIIEQMQAFKTGTREATIMHQIAKGYTNEQIKQMADYFASQKP